jgi:hypothetical protein
VKELVPSFADIIMKTETAGFDGIGVAIVCFREYAAP